MHPAYVTTSPVAMWARSAATATSFWGSTRSSSPGNDGRMPMQALASDVLCPMPLTLLSGNAADAASGAEALGARRRRPDCGASCCASNSRSASTFSNKAEGAPATQRGALSVTKMALLPAAQLQGISVF